MKQIPRKDPNTKTRRHKDEVTQWPSGSAGALDHSTIDHIPSGVLGVPGGSIQDPR